MLALARYLGQEPVAIDGLTERLAREAPDALIRAVRYSGLVLNQASPRRTELQRAASANEGLAELCRVLDILDLAYRQRVAAVEMWKTSLASLSTFDLLVHASLHAFEHLVPRDFGGRADATADADRQLAWDALGDLVAWKLRTATEAHALDEGAIGQSIVRHLRPILFEDRGAHRDEALQTMAGFAELLAAQIELNEFIGRSADAFSYDDGIRFVRQGDRLEIVEVDATARSARQRDGRRLERLHGYWFYRAVDAYVASDAAQASMGWSGTSTHRLCR